MSRSIAAAAVLALLLTVVAAPALAHERSSAPAGTTPSLYAWATVRHPENFPDVTFNTDEAGSTTGGMVRLYRYAAGSYAVGFSGFDGLFDGCAFTNGCVGYSQATAVAGTKRVCASQPQVGDEVLVFVVCRDGQGHMLETPFSVSWVAHLDPRGVFAYVSVAPSGDGVAVKPAGTYSNHGGAFTAHRIGVGRYSVKLPNIRALSTGNLQVTGGYGELGNKVATCRATGMAEDNARTKVLVACERPKGGAIDSPFSLLFTDQVGLQGDDESGSQLYAYLLDNKPSNASMHPKAELQDSTTDYRMTVVRTSTGHYSAELTGMPVGGAVQISAYGTADRSCQLVGIKRNGTEQVVKVVCFTVAGAAADAVFFLSYEH